MLSSGKPLKGKGPHDCTIARAEVNLRQEDCREDSWMLLIALEFKYIDVASCLHGTNPATGSVCWLFRTLRLQLTIAQRYIGQVVGRGCALRTAGLLKR